MRTPDDTRVFRQRYHHLLDILLIETSAKEVGRVAAELAHPQEGTGVFLSNHKMAIRTGLSVRGVQYGWRMLEQLGLAYSNTADWHNLAIPSHWREMPVYGPNERAFTCLNCGKVFYPSAKAILRSGGTWPVHKLCFCPASGFRCFQRYKKDHGWPADGDPSGRWDLFRVARGDDWPERVTRDMLRERILTGTLTDEDRTTLQESSNGHGELAPEEAEALRARLDVAQRNGRAAGKPATDPWDL